MLSRVTHGRASRRLLSLPSRGENIPARRPTTFSRHYNSISAANRVANQASGMVNAKSSHDTGAVRIDGLGADAQRDARFFGCLAFGDELKHLALARR